MTTILLLDEYQSSADGVRYCLTPEFDFFHARNRDELLALLDSQKIDLVITEMHFHPGEHGLRLIQLLQARDVKCMVFAHFPGVAMLRSAMLCGARGFVDKRDSLVSLRSAILAILNRGSFYEALLLQKITENPAKRLPRDITPGERKVIDQLYFQPALTVQLIGQRVHLNAGTVANRLLEVGRKLGVSGRKQILQKLLALGYYPEINPDLVEHLVPEKVGEVR